MDFFDDEHGQQARVLIVESGQARPCASILKSKTRFAMLLASDGRSALDVLRHHDIDVIVVDEDMPDMAAPYLLAAVQELSPTTAIIVLTVNGIGVGEDDEMMIRTLPTACSERVLHAQIESLLAANVQGATTDEAIDPTEALADALLSTELPTEAREHVAELHPDFARTMTEQELATTDVLDSDGPHNSAPVIGLPRQCDLAVRPSASVIAFSADPDVIRCLADAAQDRFPLLVASNIVRVVKLLQTDAPGVLITDVSEDRSTIAAMTARLKYHAPSLVTVAISARRDPTEMAWLINHGHIFRFLRKPLSIGRAAVCLHAALQHHESIRTAPEPRPAAAATRSDDSGIFSGVFERLKAVADRRG